MPVPYIPSRLASDRFTHNSHMVGGSLSGVSRAQHGSGLFSSLFGGLRRIVTKGAKALAPVAKMVAKDAAKAAASAALSSGGSLKERLAAATQAAQGAALRADNVSALKTAALSAVPGLVPETAKAPRRRRPRV